MLILCLQVALVVFQLWWFNRKEETIRGAFQAHCDHIDASNRACVVSIENALAAALIAVSGITNQG